MERRLGANGAAKEEKPRVEEIPEETVAEPAPEPTAEATLDSAPWPTEADEAAFRAGEPAAAAGATVLTIPALPPREERPLPALDGLVARIPADVREALDDLFRAKFTIVKRVPASALKTPS